MTQVWLSSLNIFSVQISKNQVIMKSISKRLNFKKIALSVSSTVDL